MAEMIPETIGASEQATAGEQRVFKVLRDALQPDNDFIVWFEPKAIKKLTDFLIWSNNFGLLVVEVKDWGLESIGQINPNQWQIKRRGKIEWCESPTEQARRCFIQFKRLFEKHEQLCHGDPDKPGCLRFPIGYTAIFTNITRRQAGEHGILDVLKSTFCLFDNDLRFDFNDYEARRLFVASLQKSFKAPFQFKPFGADEFKLLRFLVFPEVRISSMRQLRSSTDAQMIKALDLGQERVAKSIPQGHRVVKGVAGSGKSLVLSCRAKYLAKLCPDWRILVVCYGISFSQYLRELINSALPQGNTSNIDIVHYHELVKKLTRKSLQQRYGENETDWDARVGKMLVDAIGQGEVTVRYEAVLIDEGQDFTVEWLQSLTSLLKLNTDSLLLCVDPAQNIFGRQITYKSAGIKVQGKKPIVLKKSYRNTVEILELARTFSKVPEEVLEAVSEEEHFGSPLFPTDVRRHGARPVIVEKLLPDDQAEFVFSEIRQFVTAGDCSWCDIAVLCATPPSKDFLRRFYEAFSKRFSKSQIYWVTENRGAKLALNVGSQSVKLSTVESVKGMEFKVVFLLGLDQLPRVDRDRERERRLVYVGLTRAQDILFLVGSTRKGYLQELADANVKCAASVAETERTQESDALSNTPFAELSTGEGEGAGISVTRESGESGVASLMAQANSTVIMEKGSSVNGGSVSTRRNSGKERKKPFSPTHDYGAMFTSPFGAVIRKLVNHGGCYTAEAAEKIADEVARGLGLPEKEALSQEYSNEFQYIYRDSNQFLELKVSIWAIREKEHGGAVQNTPLWSFHCEATRQDVGACYSFGEDRWRAFPMLFAEDAWQLIHDLRMLQK